MSQRQCLPIEESDSDTSEINFDLEQISAHKYLKSVRLERERTQEIVSVEIPKNYDTREHNNEIHSSFKRAFHTKEWQEHQKELFENLQGKVCELRKSVNEEKLLTELPINIEDEHACIKYCQTNEPLLSIMFTIDSFRQIENILELFADYIEENIEDIKVKDINEFGWYGKWTYALIVCLRIPLSPEAHHSIRIIAKNCIYLVDHFTTLNNLASDSQQLLPLSLLITIIINNFHQHDLLSL